MLRRVSLVIAIVLLLALAWIGLSGGIHDFPRSATMGQKIQSVAQLAYGLFAVLSVATVFWRRRWARLTGAGWVVSCSLAAGFASVVWGGTTAGLGLLSGAGGAVIAAGILWLLQLGARGLTGA